MAGGNQRGPVPSLPRANVIPSVDYPNSSPKRYDAHCLDLASYFLADEKKLTKINDLAQHIQDAVEEWLDSQERS